MAASPRLDIAFLIERQMFAQQEVLSGERGAWAQAEQKVPHTIDQACQRGARERCEVADQTLESCHRCGVPLNLAWSPSTIGSTRRLAVQSCSPRLRAGRLSVSRPAYDTEHIVRIDFCGRRILYDIAYKHFDRYARKFI
jgi:hypothetical protein